jgi:hypothetical protein
VTRPGSLVPSPFFFLPLHVYTLAVPVNWLVPACKPKDPHRGVIDVLGGVIDTILVSAS